MPPSRVCPVCFSDGHLAVVIEPGSSSLSGYGTGAGGEEELAGSDKGRVKDVECRLRVVAGLKIPGGEEGRDTLIPALPTVLTKLPVVFRRRDVCMILETHEDGEVVACPVRADSCGAHVCYVSRH